MRFMIIGKATKESEAGVLPIPEAIAAMQQYNEELVKAGILLAAEGLAASSKEDFGDGFTPNEEIAKVKFR